MLIGRRSSGFDSLAFRPWSRDTTTTLAICTVYVSPGIRSAPLSGSGRNARDEDTIIQVREAGNRKHWFFTFILFK